jgi:hypothetical protein
LMDLIKGGQFSGRHVGPLSKLSVDQVDCWMTMLALAGDDVNRFVCLQPFGNSETVVSFDAS